MEFRFTPSRAQSKVFSAICSNLVAGWFVAIFITSDPLTIGINLLYAVIAWYLAVRAEEIGERL